MPQNLPDEHHRVVITGMGAVTSLGLNCHETFDNLVSGVSGIERIQQFDPSPLTTQIAGEVKNFDPNDYIDKKKARRIGRFTQFSIAATREAVAQSGLDLEVEDPTRVATLVSSAIGDFPMTEEQVRTYWEKGQGKMNPFTVPRVSANMAAGNISMEFGLRGPGYGVTSACTTGNHAIATAWMMLKLGLADIAITGGTEAAITHVFVDGYSAMRALSTRNDNPAKASRPFDKDRDGFVLGEGCAVLILETLEHARKRNINILAELAGVGMSCDAHHIAAPHPDGLGAAEAMGMALQTAKLNPNDIDYINANGDATVQGDRNETLAIKKVFSNNAMRTPVSSTKAMTGHLLSASSALELIVSVLALRDNIIPPTINCTHPDPDCDLDYVPHRARKCEIRAVLSNSIGWFGQSASLIVEQ